MKLKSLCVVSVSCLFFFACSEDNSSSPQALVPGISQGTEYGDLSSSIAANLTSSSSIAVSSSSEMSSSSYAVPSCKTETEDNCEYGTLVDSRDGNIYKTVKIGTQEWMTEELKYKGRFFNWAQALGLDENVCNENQCDLPNGNIQGICPEGSHLPSANEFRALFIATGSQQSYRTITFDGKTTRTEIYYDTANKLKASSGWKCCFAGDDRYGFSALPTGRKPTYGGIENDSYAIYWTSSQIDSTLVSQAWIFGGSTIGVATMEDESTIRSGLKKDRLLVRCIKDDAK